MVSNVQMMRDLYAALGQGDMPTVLGAMDPGIEWRDTAELQDVEGRTVSDPYLDGTYRWWHLPGPSPELLAAAGDGWRDGPRHLTERRSCRVIQAAIRTGRSD
jgi:hypothetical protein